MSRHFGALVLSLITLLCQLTAGRHHNQLSKEDERTLEDIDYYLSLVRDIQDENVSLDDKVAEYIQNIKNNENHESFEPFKQPPAHLIHEFEFDDICDPWEGHCDMEPIIGILTQPSSGLLKDHDGQQYILQVNDNFNKWSGSRTIAIPYDISEEGLLSLLGNINGVHFTGGSLKLIDEEGNMHPYYVTAKRIIDFSKMVKDENDVFFPILGICQGLELISIIQGDDDPRTLDMIEVHGLRTVNWIEDLESRFYDNFPEETREEMKRERVAIHFHQYAISLDTFQETPGLADEFYITATDEYDGVTFVDSMEHKEYPIFTVMYHPEYQLQPGILEDFSEEYKKLVQEIAFRTSIKFNRWARHNRFRWTYGEDNYIRMSVNRVPLEIVENEDIEVGVYRYNKNDI